MQVVKYQSGFSLIEVMVAVTLLTLVVFGIVSLQTSVLSLADTQNSQIQAYFLAQEGLQIVESMGKADISASTEISCEKEVCLCRLTKEVDYDFSCGSETEEIGMFQRHFELSQNDLQNGAWLVKSIVAWQDQTGDHQASAKIIIYD